MNLQLTRQEFLIIQKLIYIQKQDVVCGEGNGYYSTICKLNEKLKAAGKSLLGKNNQSHK